MKTCTAEKRRGWGKYENNKARGWLLSGCLELELLGLLPGELLTAKVTVSSGLLIDGTEQIELLDDDTGTEVKVLTDDLDKLLIGSGTSAVGIDEDGEGLGNTDGVRELDQAAASELGGNERLGDPAGGVGGGTVDLGPVLAGEGTTTVGTPTTVGVNNDLTASQTGIALGTTDDELAGGLEMVDGVLEEVLRNDGLDDVLHEGLAEVLGLDLLGVLDGDDDGVDAEGSERAIGLLLVLDGDLGLGVRAEPAEGAIAAEVGHAAVELVGEHNGHGHHLGSLVRGIAEHDTLVTSTNVLNVERLLDQTLRDIGRLLLDGNKDVAGLVVEALVRVVIADLLDSITDDLLVVQVGLGGDLTEHHDHTSLGGGLTGDLGEGVLSKARIQDGIRDLIANLVYKMEGG